MPPYVNVFQQDAQRQLREERERQRKSKPRAKPKPKPGPKKRPPAGSAQAAVRDVARSAANVSRAVERNVPRPTPKPAPRQLRAQSSNFSRLADQARARLASQPKRSNIQVGNMGFGYAGQVENRGGFLDRIASGFAGDVTEAVTGIPAALATAVTQPQKIPSMVTGAASDIKRRWMPVVEANMALTQGRFGDAASHYRRFGGNVQDDPLWFLLDVGLGFSAGGSATAAAGRGLSRMAPNTRIGQAGARLGNRAVTPGAPRYREPRRLVREMGENTGKGRKGPARNVVEIRRRPYSPNPITRGVQKRVVDPLVDRAIARIDARPDSALAGMVGTAARYDRRAARAGRDLSRHYELERGRVVRQEADPFRRHARKLSKPEQAALNLHLRGLLDVPDMSPAEARANVVRMMREGNAEMVAGGGVKNTKSLKNIEAIESIPDELLDLRTAPPHLVAAVEEARRIGQSATARRVAAGTLDPETARAAAQRPALMAHGGMRWDPQAGGFRPPARTDVGREAVYLPDLPVDRMAGRQRGTTSGSYKRLTQDRDRQNKGVLFGSGNVSMDPQLPVRALERAIDDELHPRMIQEFRDRFSFKRADGKEAVGKRAITAMEADPDAVALVSLKTLNDAKRRVQDLPEGQLPDSPPLSEADIFSGADGLRKARELPKSERGQLVAVSKAALDGLREGWSPTMRGGLVSKFYDNPLSLWKRGILTFAPRWYLNNAFGNTLQYGLMTGGDVRSILQAAQRRAGDAVPERVRGSLVEQTRIEAAAFRGREPSMARQRFEKVSDFGFRVNHTYESLLRRAAYINRMKKGLRDEGMVSRAQLRKMSDQELMDAIDNAPREVKEQALRQTELFLGDYVRLNPFEQNVLRRIFPWYSWMRVIGRLMLGLPFRHPKRTAIGAMVAEAAGDIYNPEDEAHNLPLYDRGRIKFPGGLVQRTMSLNPFTTHLELASQGLQRDPAGVVGSLVRDATPIGGQQAAQLYSGRNAFGDPFSAPPGYGGTVQAYGRQPMRIDPATGRPEPVTIAPPWHELAFQTVPHIPQILRAAGSRGRSPYDTATTWDIITGGKPPEELFWPDRGRDLPTEPLHPAIQPFLSIAGANIRRRNPEAERRRAIEEMRRMRDAARQTRRRKARAAARER